MAAVEMRVDLSALIDAAVSGNSERVISITRDLLDQEKNADVLIGRIGIQATLGDPDGHIGLTLAAAAMLARMLRARPAPLDEQVPPQSRALAVFARAVQVAAPALRAAKDVKYEQPRPSFPSEFIDSGKSFNAIVNEVVQKGDVNLVERALLGLYGTGADYRTLEIRAYEAIATTFQNEGHDLMAAVRGFQLLDAVEWGKSVPRLLHWLAPKIAVSANTKVPAWVEEVRGFAASNSLASVRTRLSTSKDNNALSLKKVILNNATATQVCQGVYDALIKGEASPQAVGSVIALAAAEILQGVEEDNRDLFIQVSHGLLFASAARNVFRQVQDVEALNILYTSAAYINALNKLVGEQTQAQPILPSTPATTAGGGMIAISQLESIEAQIKNKEVRAALATAQRYLNLGHDARALFGTIGLGAALNDHTADQGHSLQIVQAAGEEFIAWPRALASTNNEAFLQVALRAAAFGKQDNFLS